MKRSARLLILLGAIEAILAAIWFWMMSGLKSGSLRPSGDAADAVATTSSTLGGVMGVLAGVILVAVFVLRRKGE